MQYLPEVAESTSLSRVNWQASLGTMHATENHSIDFGKQLKIKFMQMQMLEVVVVGCADAATVRGAEWTFQASSNI